MKLLKSLFVSVHGSVEDVVTRLQNHDALVRSSLKELETRIHGAQSSFAALTRTLKKNQQDIDAAIEDEKAWTRRATEAGTAGQREKAIECLKRAHRSKQTVEALTKQREVSVVAHEKLQNTIGELQNVQRTLTLRRSELNAREQAQLVSSSPFALSVHSTEEMLERWEDCLGGAPQVEIFEGFESAIVREEEQSALEAELDRLIGK